MHTRRHRSPGIGNKTAEVVNSNPASGEIHSRFLHSPNFLFSTQILVRNHGSDVARDESKL